MPSVARKKRPLYLADWAEFQGKSAAQIAEATDADKSLVSRWFNKGTRPNDERLAQLADLFGTDIDGLYYPPPRDLTYSPDDPSTPEPIDPDRPVTVGEHTPRRGIPDDASAQLDVTAGMGGGGVSIVAEGVPGKSGMTFAAEHVSDYWRLPIAIRASMGGVKAGDITFIPVQGDSMSPTLIEGDVVVVDTRHRLPSPDGIYALTDIFGGIVVKRLELVNAAGEDDTLVDVISDNEARHQRRRWPLAELNIIGRVVRKFGIVQ